MISLPPDIHHRLRSVLLRCGPCDNPPELKAVFTDSRINPWMSELPEGTNSSARVNLTIYYLLNQYNASGKNALALFLRVLSDQKDPGNSCREDLLKLASELESLYDKPMIPAPPSDHSENFNKKIQRLWSEAYEQANTGESQLNKHSTKPDSLIEESKLWARNELEKKKWWRNLKPLIIPLTFIIIVLVAVTSFLANLGESLNLVRDYILPNTPTPTATLTPTLTPTPIPTLTPTLTPTPFLFIPTEEGYGYWIAVFEGLLSMLSRYWWIIVIIFIPVFLAVILVIANRRAKLDREMKNFELEVSGRLKDYGIVCESCLLAWHKTWSRPKIANALKAYARNHPREAEISSNQSQEFRDHFSAYHPEVSSRFLKSSVALTRSKPADLKEEGQFIDLFKFIDSFGFTDSNFLMIVAFFVLLLVLIMILFRYWFF